MHNVNFVPDDYIQTRESRRANIFYLIMLLVVLAVFGGTFLVIKARQRRFSSKAQVVNSRLAKASKAIERLEQLQSRRRQMMKTALLTAELIESVPRSLLLASLTNSLPRGVSLTRLKLYQKAVAGAAYSSRYQAAQKAGAGSARRSPEQSLRTYVEIEGVAPSDIEVAGYIARLNDSILFQEVQLVHSKKHKIDEEIFRKFKLTAVLKKDTRVAKDTITSAKMSDYGL